MTRAWLILADILVTLLLLLSFILFFLYPLEQKINDHFSETSEINGSVFDENSTLKKGALKDQEQNTTMSIEEFLRMAQMYQENPYTAVPVKVQTLDERLKELNAKIGDPVFIRIFKAEAFLEVWIFTGEKYEHLMDYPICAFSGRLGPKLKEGDKQAPEGFYEVRKGQLNPNSKFHLSFNLGYPNAYDKVHHRTGSFLMVHGNCVSIGCYAMTDSKIEEIYELVEAALNKGQAYVQVEAYPFVMTEENMAKYANYRWFDFWMELKEGYDYFEAERLPAKIDIKNGHYVVSEAKA